MFKKALKMNPENLWLYIDLGQTYLAQDMYTRAEEMFTKSLKQTA